MNVWGFGADARGMAAQEPNHDFTFPVAYSTLHPGALRDTIARTYAVENTTHCQLLRRGLNDTYLLNTPSTRYIGRVYRAGWRNEGEISYELDLLEHLARKGVSVSVALPARDGSRVQALSAPEGIRHLVVFTYAEGTPLRWTDPGHAQRAGLLLAQIHSASDDFQSPHPRIPLDFSYLIDAPIAALTPFFSHRPADWAYLEGFATRLRVRANQAVEGGLDWGPCHGDYGAKNIHVAADGKLTVFDFDLCGPGWRGIDLGLIAWGAMDENKSGLWESFVEGYATVGSRSHTAVASTPIFHAIAHLWSLGVFAGNLGDGGVLDMSDWLLDRETKFFREWEAAH